MLLQSDTSIGTIASLLGEHGIGAAYLVPTRTGLEKSIMDATEPFRGYLLDNEVHDYGSQAQGQESKICKIAYIVGTENVVPSVASFYRPETKKGDPRVWFRGLKRYVSPGNLLAVIAVDGELHVVNASDRNLLATIEKEGSPLHSLVVKVSGLNNTATELLEKMREICAMGPVTTSHIGDTGVGMTLERLLGITPNSSAGPDYKGIEIKASRRRGNTVNRVTLFSQVPSWKTSKLKNGNELLDRYGYHRDGRLQLYCTVRGQAPNSQGLFLATRPEEDFLDCLHSDTGTNGPEVVNWYLSKLRTRLARKHRETFWVKSHSLMDGEVEKHHYVEAVYTHGPILGNLEPLLSDGTVTMDFVMHREPSGRARDHGYLFKIEPSMLSALFPPPVTYDLQDQC